MLRRMRWAAVLLVLCACAPPQRKVGGLLKGLDPALGVVKLNLNNDQSVRLLKDGAFTFPTELAEGARFEATLDETPAQEDCVLAGGSGVVPVGRDALTLKVTCGLKHYGVGGKLMGLDVAGLALTELTTDQTTRPGVGQTSFAFALPLELRQTYLVVVTQEPPGRDCTVSNGVGEVSGLVNTVAVTCGPRAYVVSGEVTGLDAGVVVLAESATQQQVAVDGGGPFAFAGKVPYGTVVNVTVAAQPATEFCRVDGGTGEVRSAKKDVAVTCAGGSALGGHASGVIGTALVLREQTTGQLLPVLPLPDAGVADFAFPGVVPDGEPYAVSVDAPPAGRACVVTNGSGTMAGPRFDVDVVCN